MFNISSTQFGMKSPSISKPGNGGMIKNYNGPSPDPGFGKKINGPSRDPGFTKPPSMFAGTGKVIAR